jgi:hypothetical protein
VLGVELAGVVYILQALRTFRLRLAGRLGY